MSILAGEGLCGRFLIITGCRSGTHSNYLSQVFVRLLLHSDAYYLILSMTVKLRHSYLSYSARIIKLRLSAFNELNITIFTYTVRYIIILS